MLNINTNVSGLDELKKYIDTLNKIYNIGNDKKFINFLKNKFMETAKKVTNEKLTGNTTNDMAIEKYKQSHHIEDTENGFVLYNNCTIAADTIHPENYPNGEFSIALAFEYGIGVVGEGTYDGKYFTPWEYNVNNYNFGWNYPTEEDKSLYNHTYGYEGFEIYRYIAEEINKSLSDWFKEYCNGKEV